MKLHYVDQVASNKELQGNKGLLVCYYEWATCQKITHC